MEKKVDQVGMEIGWGDEKVDKSGDGILVCEWKKGKLIVDKVRMEKMEEKWK